MAKQVALCLGRGGEDRDAGNLISREEKAAAEGGFMSACHQPTKCSAKKSVAREIIGGAVPNLRRRSFPFYLAFAVVIHFQTALR